MSRPPLPPFTQETALQKVRAAEDGWNSRDPARVALAYPEQHAPIIDVGTFEAVQERIAIGRTEKRLGRRATNPSLLAGMVWDVHGRRMTPSHAVRHQKRYRYYVSQIESHADTNTPAWRVSAPDL